MKKQNIKKNKSTAGFAILFAVLISSLLLVLGFSVFNISLKELFISNFTSDSKKAIFAAKSAIECALYWQKKGKILTAENASWSGMVCGDGNIVQLDGTTPDFDKTKFANGAKKYISFKMYNTMPTSGVDSNDACAIANIEVTADSREPFGYLAKLTVRGYNRCTLGADSQGQTDQRLVEKSYVLGI
jgi:hypothetical protein